MHRDEDRQPRRVLALTDEASGLQAWIAVDAIVDGLTIGEIRQASFADRDEAIRQAKRWADQATLAARSADLDAGGGAVVVRETEDLDPESAYPTLASQVDRLDDVFLALSHEAAAVHAGETSERVNPRGTVPARAQAVSVLSGIQAVLWALDGDPRADGTDVVLEGFGPVASFVARGLSEEGAKVHVAAPEAVREEAEQAGHDVLEPDAWRDTECDVLVPTTSSIVTADVADQLAARGVCPATLGPVGSRKAAEVLAERQVQHAPDVLVAGGAMVEAGLVWREGQAPRVEDEIDRRLSEVYDRTRRVLADAADRDLPPWDVVLERWG